MELEISKDKIELEKELNDLDKLAIDFTKILDKLGVKHVIVSGYVPILFGRNRSSEDIDIIVEKVDKTKFDAIWKETMKKFECVITKDREDAYETYFSAHHSLRFSRRGKFIPNIEIKFPKVELDRWALDNRRKVILNKQALYISPIELQIPFKLFLGSEKDIEDAKHLYNTFKNNMNTSLFKEFMQKLNIEKIFNKYLE